jgi:uncharacterized protein
VTNVSRGALRACCALALVVAPAHGAEVKVGESLPPLRIDDLGECVIHGEDTAFEPWDSARPGRIQLVAYLPARLGVDRIHAPLYDALRKAGFPRGEPATTKLVNADDALWGTAGLVPSNIAKNKRQSPDNHLVVDTQGIGRRRWGLEEGDAAIILLDPSGKVLFFKEGELTADEIDAVVALVKGHAP